MKEQSVDAVRMSGGKLFHVVVVAVAVVAIAAATAATTVDLFEYSLVFSERYAVHAALLKSFFRPSICNALELSAN